MVVIVVEAKDEEGGLGGDDDLDFIGEIKVEAGEPVFLFDEDACDVDEVGLISGIETVKEIEFLEDG